MFLNELFLIENAKSGSFNMHDEGYIKFVSNGDYDNQLLVLFLLLKRIKFLMKNAYAFLLFAKPLFIHPHLLQEVMEVAV